MIRLTGKMMENALKKTIYLNATILDPRYKLEALKDYANFESIKTNFMMEADMYSNNEMR